MMNDDNTHSSTVLEPDSEDSFEIETPAPTTAAMGEDGDTPMQPILVWGLALLGLASLLFCFVWIVLVVIQRRKRRNIAPQGSAPNSQSPRDDATVLDEEEYLDEEKGQEAETY